MPKRLYSRIGTKNSPNRYRTLKMEKVDHILQMISKANEDFSNENFTFFIPEKYSKKFLSWCAIHFDLKFCSEYLEELKNQHSNKFNISFLHTFLILYGRCFMDATSSKSSKLEKEIFNDVLIALETHSEIMELRHNFVAHRGESESEVGTAFWILGKNSQHSEIKLKQIKRSSLPIEKIEKYQIHLHFLIKMVKARLDKHSDKLLTFFENKIPNEELIKYLINERSITSTKHHGRNNHNS